MIIHVGINEILWNKNDTDMNNIEIANTCQNYNIGKIFISAVLPSKRTIINILQTIENREQRYRF